MRLLAQTGIADVLLDEARQVVVKKRRYGADAEAFLARARVVASLSHPHLVAVLGVGLDGELPYYEMEYVPGDSLADRLGAPLPDAEVVRIGREIAGALVALHAAGFTHGGVSPAHIFAGPPVKLGNFDGTNPPWYMAPEQWDEEAVLTSATDVYALGCILFECATGAAPFEADSAVRLRELHLGSKPRALEGPVGALCAEMLAKDPAERPTATEVKRALTAPRR